MCTMDTKSSSIPFITIEEESGSDLLNNGIDSEQSQENELNHDESESKGTTLLGTLENDDTDGVNRSHSYNMAINHDEKSPLLQKSNLNPPNIKKGRFTVSKSPDISKGDFYSANIESVFQNMEPVSRKPMPNLRLDIDKANTKPHGKVSLDAEKAGTPIVNESVQGDPALLLVVSEMDQPCHAPRRPSKLFTVINYGNVSTEQIPVSPAGSAHQEIEKFSWPKGDSMLHSSQPQLREFYNSQGQRNHADRRRGSVLSTSKIKPRVRLVSGTHSFHVPDSKADDILSINSYNTTGSHHQLCLKPHLSIPDISSITSKPDILPQLSEGADITDNKYAVETVRGSAGQMSKTLLDVARRGRLFAKRKIGRLVMKDGTPNIALKNIKTRNKKFILDIFTTVLDMKWRWVLFLFSAAFIFSWLAFAGKMYDKIFRYNICNYITHV